MKALSSLLPLAEVTLGITCLAYVVSILGAAVRAGRGADIFAVCGPVMEIIPALTAGVILACALALFDRCRGRKTTAPGRCLL